jgi:hypothetical protein
MFMAVFCKVFNEHFCISDLAKYLASQQQGSQSIVNPVVQVSDVTAPILQVQDAVPGGTIIQVRSLVKY